MIDPKIYAAEHLRLTEEAYKAYLEIQDVVELPELEGSVEFSIAENEVDEDDVGEGDDYRFVYDVEIGHLRREYLTEAELNGLLEDMDMDDYLHEYQVLVVKAFAASATQDDINALGNWLERNNDGRDWNGEAYYIGNGEYIYPIYTEDRDCPGSFCLDAWTLNASDERRRYEDEE